VSDAKKAEEPPVEPHKVRSTTREYYEAILIAVVFALFVRTFVVQAFKIPSGSMEDNLLVGDHLLVNKMAYGPRLGRPWDAIAPYREVSRGDVVVFKWPRQPERDFIKRTIAVPGDVVEIRNKVVYVNGAPRNEDPPVFHKEPDVIPDSPYLSEERRYRDNLGPVSVSHGGFFMMGDNRDRSYDSRFWGEVPRGNLKGRAFIVYWSFELPAEWQRDESPTPRATFRNLAYIVTHFFTKTRWSRTFRIVH
jgi:signal peptidase I